MARIIWPGLNPVAGRPDNSLGSHRRCHLHIDRINVVPEVAMGLDKAAALKRYDKVLRENVTINDPSIEVVRSGNLTLMLGSDPAPNANMATYIGQAADWRGPITQAISFFDSRNHGFEWKWFSHDGGEAQSQVLTELGFEPQEAETMLMMAVAAPARTVAETPGITYCSASGPKHFQDIARQHEKVYGKDYAWYGDSLEREWRTGPDKILFYLAYDKDTLVSAAWVRYEQDIGSFWGGATLEDYRGRGIYRNLVALRYNAALERGLVYLLVEASAMSRPILERLGFETVGITQPYFYTSKT